MSDFGWALLDAVRESTWATTNWILNWAWWVLEH